MSIITYLRSKLQPSFCSCCAESGNPAEEAYRRAVTQAFTTGMLVTAMAEPFKIGVIETPIPGLPWRHLYSARNASSGGPIDNNCSMDVFALADGTALVFGTGYGTVRQGTAGNARTALEDASDVHSAILALGLSETCPISYVAPHGHLDHINAAFVTAMDSEFPKHPTKEIVFHAGDASRISAMPGLTAAQRSVFKSVQAKSCMKPPIGYFLASGHYASFISRPGHTPGSIDMDIFQSFGSTTALARILGSKDSNRCVKPAGAMIIQPHGNAQL